MIRLFTWINYSATRCRLEMLQQMPIDTSDDLKVSYEDHLYE